MAGIVLSRLNKHYGSLHHAVKDVDLEIADREFVALVGPSGCGKSTTLRMIAGLEDISSGEIRIGERVVNHLPLRAIVDKNRGMTPGLVADLRQFVIDQVGAQPGAKSPGEW